MSFSKSKRLPSVQSCSTGNLSASTGRSGRSRPASAGSVRSARSDATALRVSTRQPQPEELTRPPPVHVWNFMEATSCVQWAEQWGTRLEGESPSCTLPAALTEVLQSIWRDSVTRGRSFVCIVETCHNCADHRRTTKHREEKYEMYAAKVTELVAKEFSFMAVEQMHRSRHWSKKLPRRLGAFEVYLLVPDGPSSRCCQISLAHSKLMSMHWPNCAQVKQRLVTAMPGVVQRILHLRSQNWSVAESHEVMKEAEAWGLSRWDALSGLADQVAAANRALEAGQQASQRRDKEGLREAIHECEELQLADELIGGWMDELKQKNMALFSIKLQAKRFQRNAAFAAATRQLRGAQQRPLRGAKLRAAIEKAQKAELPEDEVAMAMALQSRLELVVSRVAGGLQHQHLGDVAEGLMEAMELGIQDETLDEAQSQFTSLSQQGQLAAEQRDLVELQETFGAWQIPEVAAGPEYQAILNAHKVYQSLVKQVEEAERRYEAQRWDALQKAVERLQDAHVQDHVWERWTSALQREKQFRVMHAISGAAVKLKRQLYTRRLEAVLKAEEVSLMQLEDAADAAEAHQVDEDLVAKARAEANVAITRWKDAQDAMEKKLVDRADIMIWKLQKGRVRLDAVVRRHGALWDMVAQIHEAEATGDWQALRDVVATWREERPGIDHEAFLLETSAVKLHRWARGRSVELQLRELRQEVNDILNSLRDPLSSASASEARAELQRCAKLVREMLKLGWEMTPARNARLLLALAKVQAEGGREVSLARFKAALLQVLEGSPQVVFVLDTSGAKDHCEDEVKAAAEALARCVSRNASGATYSVITYSPAEVIQEPTDVSACIDALKALQSRGGKAQTTKAFREVKKLLKDADQQLVFHLTAAPENSKDTQKALRVLDALRVSVLGLGLGGVKVENLMKISSPGLAFKVEANEVVGFVEEACREVERILEASRTSDPEEVLQRLDGA